MSLTDQIKNAVQMILNEAEQGGLKPSGIVDVAIRLYDGVDEAGESKSKAWVAEVLERADGTWTIEEIVGLI